MIVEANAFDRTVNDSPSAFDVEANLDNGGGDTDILPPSKAALEFDDTLARQWARDHA